MIKAFGYAAQSATTPLAPFSFERRDPGPRDVQIEILFCGVCHSDLHTVAQRVGRDAYPMVPGHEIVGRVTKVGVEVSKFKAGDLVGVGCMVDSCRTARAAGRPGAVLRGRLHRHLQRPGAEHRRARPTAATPTQIVVDESFVLRMPDKLRPGGRGAAAVRRHHHLLAAAPLEGRAGPEGRRRRPRRARPHGRQVRHAPWARTWCCSPPRPSKARGRAAPRRRRGGGLARTPTRWRSTRTASTSSSTPWPRRTTSTPSSTLLKRDGTMVLVGAPGEPHPSPGVFNLILKRRAARRLADRRHRRRPRRCSTSAPSTASSPTSRSSRSSEINDGLRAHAQERREVPLRHRHGLAEAGRRLT